MLVGRVLCLRLSIVGLGLILHFVLEINSDFGLRSICYGDKRLYQLDNFQCCSMTDGRTNANDISPKSFGFSQVE